MKGIVYFLILTSFLPAYLFAIDLGYVQLSPFRISIIISVLLVLLFIVKRKINISDIFNNQNYSSYFMIVWFFYAVITILWVEDLTSWLQAVFYIGIGVTSILFLNLFLRKERDFKISFYIIWIIIFINNFLGWYELFTGDYLFRIQSHYNSKNYLIGMFGGPNEFATPMLFGVFISYFIFKRAKNNFVRVISLITMISSSVLVLLSQSRANILGLFLGLFCFMILLLKRKSLKNYLPFIGLLLSIGTVTTIFSGNNIISQLNRILQFNFSNSFSSDGIRMNLIKNGLYFLTKTNGFGVGAGNIEYWMETYLKYPTSGIVNMHNWWVEILVAYGIGIFTLYIIFYTNLFISIYLRFRNSETEIEKEIAIVILCCMSGYVIAGISSSSNIGRAWLWLFWGIAIAFQGSNISNIDKKIKF